MPSSTSPSTSPSPPIQIDTSAYYRLTNDHLGPSQALDVVNINDGARAGKLKMANTGNYSGQYWHFVPLPPYTTSTSTSQPPPKYALRTQYRGEGFSLDVRNDAGENSRTVQLAATGNYSGQFWNVTPWEGGEGEGKGKGEGEGAVRLTNDFTGEGVRLDTYRADDGGGRYEPVLRGDGDGEGDDGEGQRWRLERIGEFRGS